ncbi:MAG: hypothetical protein KDA62_13580, partial [Planctomycetales bacterium]|nr:hypothetical protein [Planctomycetales bacterium]
MLTGSRGWCYVTSQGAYRVKPVVADVRGVFNFGESLFGIECTTTEPLDSYGELRGRPWTQYAGVSPCAV